MKYFLVFTLIMATAPHSYSEISDDWLDDDILFDDSDNEEFPQSKTSSEINSDQAIDQQKNDLEKNQSVDELNQESNQEPGQVSNEKAQVQESEITEQTQQDELNSQADSIPVQNPVNNQVNAEATASAQLDDVVITGSVDKTTMTEATQKLFSMPGAGGDPLKALSALPGINSASSFSGAPSVRGSAPEDNTFLVDNLPVANLYHLLGYSIFSDNIVQNFDIQTGAFPAKYAGGTGAAIYVDLREPKNDPVNYVVDLGMFNSGVFVESKIDDSQSFFLGARKSTISFFAPLIVSDDEPEDSDDAETDEEESGAPIINQFPNSDDFYFKYTNKINNKNKINFLVLGALDYAGVEFQEGSGVEDNEPALLGELAINTYQATTGLNWIYQHDKFNKFDTSIGYLFFNLDIVLGDGYYNKLFVNSLIAKSNYEKSDLNDRVFTTGLEMRSDIADYKIRTLNTPCSNLEPDCSFTGGLLIEATDNSTINYFDGFAQDQWFVNDSLTWTNGLHISYDDYIQDAIIQPRSKLEFNWYDEWLVNAAFGVHHQFPEITNVLPKFGNPDLKNITALHYVFGIEKNTYSGLKIKADTYYKKITNVVVATGDERQYSNQAYGDAYGLEVLLEQEKVGAFSGFLALSLSKSTRTNEITNETAAFELDTPFVLDWVLNYEPNERWKIGSKWNLKSGKLYTPIIGATEYEDFPGSYKAIYGEFNSKRFPLSHQLDLRIEYKKQSPKKEITYYVDIINLYNQKNVESYSYNADYSEIEEETGGFPFLPLFGMKVSF